MKKRKQYQISIGTHNQYSCIYVMLTKKELKAIKRLRKASLKNNNFISTISLMG